MVEELRGGKVESLRGLGVEEWKGLGEVKKLVRKR